MTIAICRQLAKVFGDGAYFQHRAQRDELGHAAYAAFARLLKDGFPVGVAYAIWAGVGVAAVAVIGAVFLHEGFNLAKGIGLFLVISGVLVLELGTSH
jgi:multidrug transporter EmrE-like cation transporter